MIELRGLPGLGREPLGTCIRAEFIPVTPVVPFQPAPARSCRQQQALCIPCLLSHPEPTDGMDQGGTGRQIQGSACSPLHSPRPMAEGEMSARALHTWLSWARWALEVRVPVKASRVSRVAGEGPVLAELSVIQGLRLPARVGILGWFPPAGIPISFCHRWH